MQAACFEQFYLLHMQCILGADGLILCRKQKEKRKVGEARKCLG
jgi:hypothetical protein